MAGRSRGRSSKTPWGWIAFGVGLAACVGVGGVVGVMLGQDDDANAADAERVAALALDTRGLNEDALSLSRAIEEAIEREEVEAEAESLRAELSRLDVRAGRIRARAEAEAADARGREVSTAVNRGLGEISRTVAVFERDVVGRLESVIDEVPPQLPDEGTVGGPSLEEALAEVNTTLEAQGEALTALAENLEGSDEGEDLSFAEGADGEGKMASGAFEGALVPPDSTLEVSYELGDAEAVVDPSGAEPGEAAIMGSATGELTLKNTGSRRERVEPPTFQMVLYWTEEDIPATTLDGVLRAAPSSSEVDSEEADFGGEGEVELVEGEPCGYEIEGERHCALARFSFDDEVDHERNAAGELVLRPDDEIDLDALEPEGSLIVREGKADSVADFLESRPPDLVQVLAVESSDSFRPACTAPRDPEEGVSDATGERYGEASSEGTAVPGDETAATTLGLLSGDGEVIFEAEETGRPMSLDPEGEPEAPECYTLPAE